MTQVIDFSWVKPQPQPVKDAGYAGVVGYLGHDRTGKLLSKQWFDAYTAAGLTVNLVWELGNQRALAGYDAGHQDATEAIGQAEALGYAPGAAIYYVLEDPSKLATSQWPSVRDYARGLADAGGPFRRGGYGSKGLTQVVKADGHIDLCWYVGPWGNDYAGAALVQTYKRTMPIAGSPDDQYDEDLCCVPDWGQHPTTGGGLHMDDDVQAAFAAIKTDVDNTKIDVDRVSADVTSLHEKVDKVLAALAAGGGGTAPVHFTGTVDIKAAQ